MTALTSLSFSGTSRHLLAGFSFHPLNHVARDNDVHLGERSADRIVSGTPETPFATHMLVAYTYSVAPEVLKKNRSLNANMDVSQDDRGGVQDEINVAVFAPGNRISDGINFGTRKGRIRIFKTME